MNQPFLASLLLTAAPLLAQTTGVAGINDYTVNGSTPGSTSCASLCFPNGNLPLTFAVNTVPGNPVLVVVTDCPCRGCITPWFNNTCSPAIPPASFPLCAGTNQSLDLFLGPGCNVIFLAWMTANAAGQASMTVNVPPFTTPPCSQVFATQAIVIDACGTGGPTTGPGPFVITQAYTLVF